MKRSPQHPQVYVALFVLGLLIGLTGGCAHDPRLQLAQAERAFEITQYKLVEEAGNGKLSRDEVLLIDPSIQAIRATLDDAEQRIAAGDTKAFRADMNAVNAILLRLAETYLAPTTQPGP